MGVLVFVMVLTSLDEKNSMHLMRAEVPGPEADKLVPKARGTARILYGMYFALTTIEVVFLLAVLNACVTASNLVFLNKLKIV